MAGSGPLRLAIVGCGNISKGYATTIARYPEQLSLIGACDVDRARAQALVAEHGGRAFDSLDDVLAGDQVEAVVNLTTHHAHVPVVRSCLSAGKHVLTEKPIALDPAQARELAQMARQRGVRLASAPTTFLGEAQQTAMKIVRDGTLGTIRVAYAEMNWGRIEDWHPSPESFYDVGAMFDVGVYPITQLCATLGPVQRVTGMGRFVHPQRTARDGHAFTVTTPDWMCGLLELASGPIARVTCSFWTGPTRQTGIEFHGDAATLCLQQPHEFASPLQLRRRDSEKWTDQPLVREPYRGVDWARGLVELHEAIRQDRPHRPSAEMAAHVVEVIAAVHQSARAGSPVTVTSRFDPPPPMPWAQ